MSISVGGAGYVGAVWKESAEEFGFMMESRVKGCRKEYLGDWRGFVGEQGREFES